MKFWAFGSSKTFNILLSHLSRAAIPIQSEKGEARQDKYEIKTNQQAQSFPPKIRGIEPRRKPVLHAARARDSK